MKVRLLDIFFPLFLAVCTNSFRVHAFRQNGSHAPLAFRTRPELQLHHAIDTDTAGQQDPDHVLRVVLPPPRRKVSQIAQLRISAVLSLWLPRCLMPHGPEFLFRQLPTARSTASYART